MATEQKLEFIDECLRKAICTYHLFDYTVMASQFAIVEGTPKFRAEPMLHILATWRQPVIFRAIVGIAKEELKRDQYLQWLSVTNKQGMTCVDYLRSSMDDQECLDFLLAEIGQCFEEDDSSNANQSTRTGFV